MESLVDGQLRSASHRIIFDTFSSHDRSAQDQKRPSTLHITCHVQASIADMYNAFLSSHGAREYALCHNQAGTAHIKDVAIQAGASDHAEGCSVDEQVRFIHILPLKHLHCCLQSLS